MTVVRARVKSAVDITTEAATAAIYVRLTRAESLETGLSAPAQRREAETYIADANLGNFVVYEESEPVGGDVAFERRKAGKRLVEDIAAGKVQHVVVRDIDRLVRSDRLWLQFRDLCLTRGVTIHTAAGPVPLASPSDRFASGVKVLAATYEREQTADRGRRAKREAARQGRHVGGPPPFGYTSQSRLFRELRDAGLPEAEARAKAERRFPHRATLYKDAAEAKIVKTIFDLYVGRQQGCRSICRWLNNRGHRRRSGKLWHPDKVRRVLTDPTVAGFTAYDERRFLKPHSPATPKADQELFQGQHPAIITEQRWREAQETRKANKHPATGLGNAGKHNRRYALSGVLLCQCGAPMTIASQQKARGFAYYACRRRRDYGPGELGGCQGPRVPVKQVDEVVWATIMQIFTTPAVVDDVHEAAWRSLRQHRRQTKQDPNAATQLAKITSDLRVWYERHDGATSKFEKDAAWQRIVHLVGQQQELQALADSQAVQVSELPAVTKEAVREFLQNLVRIMPQMEDRGAKVIQSLVDDHRLEVRLLDTQQVSVSLAIRPFGNVLKSTEHAVVVERTSPLPKGTIDAWLDEHRGQHVCEVCQQPIEVARRHYWRGIPRNHRDCHVNQLARSRSNPDSGRFYNGSQAAKVLGISRTQFGRWIGNGQVSAVERRSNVLLFEKSVIDELARVRRARGDLT